LDAWEWDKTQKQGLAEKVHGLGWPFDVAPGGVAF
jgi:hypothetical protein